ncbi:putative transcription factor interactor and regulator CCHC(Zn) family [Helianthus annuus]|nr:putative transcription factor interactor and regulator CCHC(Zn) family [Helianthus annuus]
MIKSKKALLKKEIDLFTSLPGEGTKKLIKRYCHLVRSMSLLDINKEREEWVDKLADALPQKEWGTFLMILKNTGEYDGLTISQFIEKIEGQDLEQQKIARMSNPNSQQDVKMYFKGGVQDIEASPKIQTAFSAENSSGTINQTTSSSSGVSSYPSVNPKSSASSFQSQSSKSGNGCVIQCNIALNLPNGQSFSEEVAKDHMALLATVLESYEGLVAGRIRNSMLTKEDYDQIDAEEMELMDIKWCLASVLRRAEKFKMITGINHFLDAHVSTLGFDKSKVTCFRCREKGHFKRECKNQEASGAKNPFGKDDYYRKAIYQQVAHQPHQQKEPQTAHARMIEDANKKAYYGIIDQDNEKVAEGFSWDNYISPDSKIVALIAKIVKEPDLFTEWMKVVGVNEKNQDEESLGETEGETSSKEQKKKKCESVVQKVKSEQSEEVKYGEKIVETEKVIEIEKVVEVEKIIEVEKIVEITKPCLKCLESCKQCEEKDEKLTEFEKMKEQLLFNLNYVKESYEVLNITVTGLQKTNSEREDALTMMNAVMMSKQKAINHYIEECAKLKQELETERIENERIRRLLQSYSSSDYLIDRIYPTVAGMEVFQYEKPKKKDTGKKQSVSYNKCPPPIWKVILPGNQMRSKSKRLSI